MKLINKIFITICMLFVSFIIFQVQAATNKVTNGFTPAQTKQIKTIIHDYLVQNPTVLVEASRALQEQQMKDMRVQAMKVARENTDDLFRANDPIAGNPKGKITMVAFLDYQCPFCRQMTSSLASLIKANPDLRVVFKEFPVHGKYSVLAAKAALAANLQNKYWPLHEAMMNLPVPLSESAIMGAAQKLGLDMKKLSADMAKDELAQNISDNYILVRKLRLIGTPTYFIAKSGVKNDPNARIEIIPGMASLQDLQDAVDKVK